MAARAGWLSTTENAPNPWVWCIFCRGSGGCPQKLPPAGWPLLNNESPWRGRAGQTRARQSSSSMTSTGRVRVPVRGSIIVASSRRNRSTFSI